MKTNCMKLICGLALLGAATSVSAEPMTYTMTSHLTGSLGGTEFTNAAATLTTTADTTNIFYVDYAKYYLFEKTTIQIDGLNLATFDDSGVLGSTPSTGIFATDNSIDTNGLGWISFINVGDYGVEYILGFITLAPTYDLSTAASFTWETLPIRDGPTEPFYSLNFDIAGPVPFFSTDQGNLVITGTAGDATFTAAAVPEPASAMMLMFGAAVGLAIHRARRSALRR